MIHPDDMQYPFAVVVKKYRDSAAASWSQHYALSGAIRSARSIIGGRKHRVRDLATCQIWDKRSNALLSVSEAEERK
jgi:hypothetical protein